MTSEFSHLRIYVFKKVPWENCICCICVLASDHLLRIPSCMRQAGGQVLLTQGQTLEPQVWSPVVSSTSLISTSDPSCHLSGWWLAEEPSFMPLRSKNSAPLKNIPPCPEGSSTLTQHPGLYSQQYGFSSSYVQMWELDHKEGWVPKNWCFQTVVLEKTLESPLDGKEIKSVNPKRNQPWIYIGRTDAEAPIVWLPNAKSWVIGKDPDAGKDWGQGEGGSRGWGG